MCPYALRQNQGQSEHGPGVAIIPSDARWHLLPDDGSMEVTLTGWLNVVVGSVPAHCAIYFPHNNQYVPELRFVGPLSLWTPRSEVRKKQPRSWIRTGKRLGKQTDCSFLVQWQSTFGRYSSAEAPAVQHSIRTCRKSILSCLASGGVSSVGRSEQPKAPDCDTGHPPLLPKGAALSYNPPMVDTHLFSH